jgi:hypothetical protein
VVEISEEDDRGEIGAFWVRIREFSGIGTEIW